MNIVSGGGPHISEGQLKINVSTVWFLACTPIIVRKLTYKEVQINNILMVQCLNLTRPNESNQIEMQLKTIPVQQGQTDWSRIRSFSCKNLCTQEIPSVHASLGRKAQLVMFTADCGFKTLNRLLFFPTHVSSKSLIDPCLVHNLVKALMMMMMSRNHSTFTMCKWCFQTNMMMYFTCVNFIWVNLIFVFLFLFFVKD